MQTHFLRFDEFCLKIPHTEHNYILVRQAIKLVSLADRHDKFSINFIIGIIESLVDTHRFQEQLNFRISSNTRLQCSFHSTINKTNFSRNSPLSEMIHNVNLL